MEPIRMLAKSIRNCWRKNVPQMATFEALGQLLSELCQQTRVSFLGTELTKTALAGYIS